MVNYSDSRTAEEICESSSKMITFIDLAGHHKYLKTTIFGLTSYCPDFAMLVVSANTGIGKCAVTQPGGMQGESGRMLLGQGRCWLMGDHS